MEETIKKEIRNLFKNSGKIVSLLGVIEIEPNTIGESRTSLVYKGKLYNNNIAIKFLCENYNETSQTNRLQRFIAEFFNITKLKDKSNLMSIYHFALLEIGNYKIPYIVMEFCEMTLKEKISKSGLIKDLDQFEIIFNQLCKCVNYLHKNSIIHRDLKPENIFYRFDGSLILGDFGISWFDPEIHDISVRTDKGDRLANFQFSSPEQLEKRIVPKTTMDIYAIGQILYWTVTGKTIKGSGSQKLHEIAKDLIKYDHIIDKMTCQLPENRYQNIEEIYSAIKNEDRNTVHLKEQMRILKCIEEFDNKLARIIPGKTELILEKDRTRINKSLLELSKGFEKYSLWRNNGTGNSQIRNIKIFNDFWVIDHYELNISKIWIYRDVTIDYNFIVIKSEPMPSFGIYNEKLYRYEEAAYYKGKYITRGEYDDGVAEIEGQITDIRTEAELRVRSLEKTYWFLASQFNAVLLSSADDSISEIINNVLLKSDNIDKPCIDHIIKLPRHLASSMFA